MSRNNPNTVNLEVLVVSHYYAAHGGGVERIAQKLIEEVAAVGPFAFTWAASDCDPANVAAPHQALPMRSANVIEQFLGLPWPIWSPGSLLKLRRAVAKADVVWLHDTLYLGNILAFHWAQKMGKPLIITQHLGLIPYRNPLFHFAMRLAEKCFTFRMLRLAKQTTFISDRVAEYYYQNVPFTRAIQIIPNGVEVRQFHPPMAEKRAWLRQQFALRADQPVMLFVGRFVERKGLEVIRELARMLPDWRFWMAGRGSFKPECWHAPNIHVFNDRQDASLAELYQAADLLILPSYGEGFPLVIQEAFACGLPAVCSPETAAGSRLAAPMLQTVPVDPKDPIKTAEAWAGVLRSLAPHLPHKHPDYNLAEFASSSWAWPVIASAYADILRLLGRVPNDDKTS